MDVFPDLNGAPLRRPFKKRVLQQVGQTGSRPGALVNAAGLAPDLDAGGLAIGLLHGQNREAVRQFVLRRPQFCRLPQSRRTPKTCPLMKAALTRTAAQTPLENRAPPENLPGSQIRS